MQNPVSGHGDSNCGRQSKNRIISHGEFSIRTTEGEAGSIESGAVSPDLDVKIAAFGVQMSAGNPSSTWILSTLLQRSSYLSSAPSL